MENSLLNRKERLILTAIDVIDELGMQGLSIREVAQRQSITTAAIFSHFKSKNDLISAVLDNFMQYDDSILQSVIVNGLHSKSAIIHCIDLYFTYFENYPAITSLIFLYDGLKNEPVLAEKIKNIFDNRSRRLTEFIKEAQADHELRDDVKSKCITDVIIGSGRMICLRWRMEGNKFPLKEKVLYCTNAILDSFTPR